MIAVAVVGSLTSLRITRVPASGAAKLIRLNPFGEVVDGLRRLRAERPLWLTVIGISFFWFLGALVQINLLFFGKELLQLDEFHIGLLGTFLAVGIGAGSLAAGRLSGDHIELGLVPLGSVAMGVCLGLVALSAPSYLLTGMVARIRNHLAPKLFRQTFAPGWETLEHLQALMPNWTRGDNGETTVVAWNAAFCAVELALLDWSLRVDHCALADLLPPARFEVVYSGVISADEPKDAAALAKRMRHLNDNRSN